jgi:type VI secretion system secreted protein VgrG
VEPLTTIAGKNCREAVLRNYTQINRLLEVNTPLGPDVLLLTGFTGREAISGLFELHLELQAERETKIPFEKLMGQSVSVRVRYAEDKDRWFNGIVSRFSQGGRDEEFTHYRAEVVPQLWLWTRKVQSRIFQHLTIPEILKHVLDGLKVVWEIHDKYEPRDYCVQYRESDFAFASRLMEEEGIHYYFKHTDGSHEMVVTDTADKHPDMPVQSTVKYDEVSGGRRSEPRITVWEKTQELRSGKYTLWDHCFELPGKHLEAERPILDTAAVGAVTHHLKVACNDKLEIYDYPGGYAQRFDGIDKGGAPRPGELQKIFHDNKRTVTLRMEQEQLRSLEIRGAGDCGQFTSGRRFTLEQHFDADGHYLLTGVQHTAKLGGNYRSGEDVSLEYRNEFTAIPAALPYRPQRVTPKPSIVSMQTAVVVGPPGEEIFCDKYGRVKVQFHWDRQGKLNADSSCWVRVGQPAAGKGFGAVSLPRIGQEVIVGFEEGDPDMPLIVGSVYNDENMPPYKLPEERTFSGVKHQSHRGVAKNAGEIRFQNQLGTELLLIHAETDSLQQTENNQRTQVGNVHRHEVGQTYHVVVGKPVNVNQALAGIRSVIAGSGAGGATKEQPWVFPDNTEVDVYPEPGGLRTEVQGFSQTFIQRVNWTEIGAPLKPNELIGEFPPRLSDFSSTYPPRDSSQNNGVLDTYICHGSAKSTYDGSNTTQIGGDNSTNIDGEDHYSCGGTAHSDFYSDNYTNILFGTDYYYAKNSNSTVTNTQSSYAANKDEATLVHAEADAVHLEAAGIHIELNLMKLNTDGFTDEKCPIKIFALG